MASGPQLATPQFSLKWVEGAIRISNTVIRGLELAGTGAAAS